MIICESGDVPCRERQEAPKKVTLECDKLGLGLWRGWTGKLEHLGEYDIHQAGATGSSSYQAKAQQACAHSLCILRLLDDQGPRLTLHNKSHQ